MPTKANINLYRGDDETRLIRLTHRDGTPYDLTPIARFDLHALADEQTVIRLSSETGEITPTQTQAGEILIDFPHTLTANANWTEAQYDLQLTDQRGQIKTVLMGKIKLTHDITQLPLGATNEHA